MWVPFQAVGKVHEVIDLCNIMCIEVATVEVQFRRNTGDIPSGPTEVSLLMFSRDLRM